MVLTATTLLLYREPSKIGFTIPAGRFPDPQRPPRTTPDNNGSVSIRNNIIFTLFRKRLHKSASSVIFFPFFLLLIFLFTVSMYTTRYIRVVEHVPGRTDVISFFFFFFRTKKTVFFFLSPRGFFVSRALYLATMRILFTRHRVQCHRDKYEYCTRTPSFATIVYYNNIRFGQLLYLYNNKKNKKMYI